MASRSGEPEINLVAQVDRKTQKAPSHDDAFEFEPC